MKSKGSLFVIVMLVVMVATSLLTALGMYAFGIIFTNPIELTFEVEDEEKVYDGTPLTVTNYKWDSAALAKGHKARVTPIGEQTDVGTCEGTLSVQIFDENGFEVTNKYSIKVESASLTVTPLTVKVKLPEQSVMYTGRKIYFNEFELTEGALVQGHKVAASVSEIGLINVGEKLPNDLQPMIVDEQNRDVTNNYTVYYVVGDVKILPRPISVKPVNFSGEYDGEEHVCDTFELLSGSFADNQYGVCLINYGAARMKNVGKMDTSVSDFTVYETDGVTRVDVTDNYEIDRSTLGFMEITPKYVTVSPMGLEFTYNGEEFKTEGVNESNLIQFSKMLDARTIKDLGFDANDTATIETSLRNQFNFKSKSVIIKNAGVYKYTLEHAQAVEPNSRYANFEISFGMGEISVAKRPVWVSYGEPTQSDAITKHYDGKPIDESAIEYSNFNVRAINVETSQVTDVVIGEYKVISARLDMSSAQYDNEEIPSFSNSTNIRLCDLQISNRDTGEIITDNLVINYTVSDLEVNGTILPRTDRLTVICDEIIYVGNPDYVNNYLLMNQTDIVKSKAHAVTLCEGDTVVFDHYNMLAIDMGNGYTYSLGFDGGRADLEYYTVTNADGKDVSAAYKFDKDARDNAIGILIVVPVASTP